MRTMTVTSKSLIESIRAAISHAVALGEPIKFTYNYIDMIATAGSDAASMECDYYDVIEKMQVEHGA